MSDTTHTIVELAGLFVTGTAVVVSVIVAIIGAAYTLTRHSNAQHTENVRRFEAIGGEVNTGLAKMDGKIDVLTTKVDPMYDDFVHQQARKNGRK